MSESTVAHGAAMSCSLGTELSTLLVPEHHGAGLKGGSQATIADSEAYVNIPPFGMCKRIPPPLGPVTCTPKTCMKWINGKKDLTVAGELALLDICIVPCMLGGVIRLETSGQ